MTIAGIEVTIDGRERVAAVDIAGDERRMEVSPM
jgi:hypothetical protein